MGLSETHKSDWFDMLAWSIANKQPNQPNLNTPLNPYLGC
jgi:hypothetical protein